MSYLYRLHGKFRKALTCERTENVSNLIWKYFLMVTYLKFTQDIPPFCAKAGGYVYFILLSSAATIEFFSFSLPTRRFMKSLSLSWHKKWCSWDNLQLWSHQIDFVRDFLCRPFHFQWEKAFLLELTLHQYLLKLNSINWRQSIYLGPTHVLRITRQIQVKRYCTTKILPHSNTKNILC